MDILNKKAGLLLTLLSIINLQLKLLGLDALLGTPRNGITNELDFNLLVG